MVSVLCPAPSLICCFAFERICRGWLLFAGVGMDFGGCGGLLNIKLNIKLILLDCLTQWVCTSRLVLCGCCRADEM
mgnify:CR=1 FL=1